MIVNVGRYKYSVYAIDFETHNDEESIALGETGIWLGCLINEDSKVTDEASYFYTVEELLERLEKMTKPDKHNHKEPRILIYDFHLSFEWSFILPVLLKQGYTYKEDIGDEDEKVFNTVSTKSVSSVWSITLKIRRGKSRIIFRDLNKIFSGTLRALAKSFDLKTQKGEIDYTINRRHNWVVTDEEKAYCFKDVRIIVEILQEMHRRDDKAFWNSTSSASYSMRQLLSTAYPNSISPMKDYRKEYPVLGKEETEFLRESVSGGITYPTPSYMFKEINTPILHIDAHQMHPTQGYLRRFPYGFGEYHIGKPDDFSKINCVHIRISYTGVKLHSVIQLIGLDLVENYELTVWDFEIPTMYRCYENLKIEYIDYYAYRAKYLTWRNYYKDNYLKRLVAKKEKDAFGILYYKLLNNSSYGKLLEKPHNVKFENYINDIGVIDSLEHEVPDDELKDNAKYTYLPVGSAIPAYSRVMLIETAFKFGWEKVIYFDTDSIFVIDDEETEKVRAKIPQEDMLGNWGREEDIIKGEFDAPKRYKLQEVGHQYATVRCAGFNASLFEEVDFQDVDLVQGEYTIKRAYKVRGGMIVADQAKIIQIQAKYQHLYDKNYGEVV